MITFADATFDALDALQVDVLVVFVSSERKVLRGAAGLADWRLCGGLSRSLLDASFSGGVGEQLIMPTRGRIAPQRLLVLGSGKPTSNLNSETLIRALDVAARAGFRRMALELPPNIDPQVASEVISRTSQSELILIGVDPAVRQRIEGSAERGGGAARETVRARR